MIEQVGLDDIKSQGGFESRCWCRASIYSKSKSWFFGTGEMDARCLTSDMPHGVTEIEATESSDSEGLLLRRFHLHARSNPAF